MLERFVILAAALLGLTIAALVVRTVARRGTDQLRRNDAAPLWSALRSEPDGRATVVVFSSPGCVACRTAQQPAVETVAERFGLAGLRMLHVDIGQDPSAARTFRVLTAPSTAVLAADGSLKSLNHGFASVDRLTEQLSAAGARPAFAGLARPPAQPTRLEPAPDARR